MDTEQVGRVVNKTSGNEYREWGIHWGQLEFHFLQKHPCSNPPPNPLHSHKSRVWAEFPSFRGYVYQLLTPPPLLSFRLPILNTHGNYPPQSPYEWVHALMVQSPEARPSGL